MRRRPLDIRVASLVAVAAALAILAGCGGGDDSTSESTGNGSSGETVSSSSLSKQQFIKQASAACERERKNLVQEVNDYLEKHSEDGLSEEVLLVEMAKATLLPTIEDEIAAIRAVGAPEGEEDQVEQLLVVQQEAVEEVKELKKAPSLEDIENVFLEATDKFNAYGFSACTNSA